MPIGLKTSLHCGNSTTKCYRYSPYGSRTEVHPVVTKLANVTVAEAVVAVERKKEADSLSKIESITATLNALKNN